jgi:hypothetical protein
MNPCNNLSCHCFQMPSQKVVRTRLCTKPGGKGLAVVHHGGSAGAPSSKMRALVGTAPVLRSPPRTRKLPWPLIACQRASSRLPGPPSRVPAGPCRTLTAPRGRAPGPGSPWGTILRTPCSLGSSWLSPCRTPSTGGCGTPRTGPWGRCSPRGPVRPPGRPRRSAGRSRWSCPVSGLRCRPTPPCGTSGAGPPLCPPCCPPTLLPWVPAGHNQGGQHFVIARRLQRF